RLAVSSESAVGNALSLAGRQAHDAVQIKELPALRAQRIERAAGEAPGTDLELIAGAAGGALVVAIATGLFVEHGPEAVVEPFDFLERVLALNKRGTLSRG